MGELVGFCAGADLKIIPAKPIGALLLNVIDHGSTLAKIRAAQEMIRLSRPKRSMFDSSGFQLLQGQLNGKGITSDPDQPMKTSGRQINLVPKHVMEIASMFQPNIVVGLDLPLRKFKDPAEKKDEFERNLKYNVRWAYDSAMWQKVYCPEAQFFMPIQCYDLNQLDSFFSRIDGIAYDGVSMPVRELNLAGIALFLASFYKRRISRVHLLGTFTLEVITLCAFMARHFFEWVSIDATSWRMAADKGEFCNPLDLSREIVTPSAIINPDLVNDCPCPFCQGIRFSNIQGLPRKEKIDLLRKHNWWVMDRACHDFYAKSADIVSLERLLRSRCKRQELVDEMITTLSLIHALKDDDIEVLQNILTFRVPTRKPSKTSRRQSVPA